jgi:hypothetical protein
VKDEMATTHANSGIESTPPLRDSLSVEVKVREVDPKAFEASASEVALATAAQGWMIHLLVLGAVLAIATVYVGVHIGKGWVPADDGILGQSALRVMQGQLPHRDFAEIYTGGLSVIHAVAFRVFGVSLMSLRLCAFLFFLAWIPAVYYVALRFTKALPAGLITLVAVAWSYPNYPAAMPSWYNLFLATFGAAALLRYVEARRLRWLFVAGVCGGVSILIKVIGAYYIAGVLLFLVFVEQSDVASDDQSNPKAPKAGENAIPYRIFSTGALLLFLATVLYVFHARLGSGEFYHFVLPAVAVVGLILLGERDVPQTASSGRFRGLMRLVVPFSCGVLTPVIVFLAPYARSGAVGQFFSGVTSSAIARSVGLGVLRPVAIEKSVYALALAGLLAAAMYLREFQSKAVGAAVALGLALTLSKATTSGGIVSDVWYSVATLTPLVALMGVWVLRTRPKSGGLAKIQRQRLMVLVSLAAMCGLVQYPFAAPIYLLYALPLTLLAAVAIVVTAKRQPATYVLAAVAGFYLLFGVVMLVPDYVYELTHKVGQMEELHLPRAGGLRIEYAADFTDLIHLLQQHSPNGLMYAGNDCPELYFLSGLKNVTRDDGDSKPEELLQALQSNDLKLVVINESPFFPSARMSPAVRAAVEQRFPESQMAGIFHVYWRP